MAANSTPNPTWYDILGVGNDATPEEIKAAWRAATDKFEPGSGTSHFRLFNEAADVLLDPGRRASYDAELAGAPEVEPDAEPAVEPEVEPAVEPAVEPVATVDDEPAPEAEPGQELPPAAPATGPMAVLARLNNLVLAVVAVLAVASLVLVAFVALHLRDRVAVADAGPDAAASAERALKAALSYDYRHMEADRDRAVKFLTPEYEKDYRKTFALLTEGPDGTPGGAVKTKAVVTAEVLDTAVVDAERDRVRIIAFVNQSSVKGTAEPAIFQNRVVATMVHRGDSWLLHDIKSY